MSDNTITYLPKINAEHNRLKNYVSQKIDNNCTSSEARKVINKARDKFNLGCILRLIDKLFNHGQKQAAREHLFVLCLADAFHHAVLKNSIAEKNCPMRIEIEKALEEMRSNNAHVSTQCSTIEEHAAVALDALYELVKPIEKESFKKNVELSFINLSEISDAVNDVDKNKISFKAEVSLKIDDANTLFFNILSPDILSDKNSFIGSCAGQIISDEQQHYISLLEKLESSHKKYEDKVSELNQITEKLPGFKTEGEIVVAKQILKLVEAPTPPSDEQISEINKAITKLADPGEKVKGLQKTLDDLNTDIDLTNLLCSEVMDTHKKHMNAMNLMLSHMGLPEFPYNQMVVPHEIVKHTKQSAIPLYHTLRKAFTLWVEAAKKVTVSEGEEIKKAQNAIGAAISQFKAVEKMYNNWVKDAAKSSVEGEGNSDTDEAQTISQQQETKMLLKNVPANKVLSFIRSTEPEQKKTREAIHKAFHAVKALQYDLDKIDRTNVDYSLNSLLDLLKIRVNSVKNPQLAEEVKRVNEEIKRHFKFTENLKEYLAPFEVMTIIEKVLMNVNKYVEYPIVTSFNNDLGKLNKELLILSQKIEQCSDPFITLLGKNKSNEEDDIQNLDEDYDKVGAEDYIDYKNI